MKDDCTARCHRKCPMWRNCSKVAFVAASDHAGRETWVMHGSFVDREAAKRVLKALFPGLTLVEAVAWDAADGGL